MILSLDFETRSTVDLRRTGVYPYAEDPTTDLWMFAWAIDDGPVELWHPGEPIPPEIADQVQDFEEIRGWNVNFERVIWWLILHPRYGAPRPEMEQFVDTAAEAAALALPRSLKNAAHVMGMTEQKDKDGRRLMLQMSKPRKPRKGEDPDGLYWWDTPEKIQRLGEYCVQDVKTERELARNLRRLSSHERQIYLLDQRMNDRGIRLDIPAIRVAQELVDEGMERANRQIQTLTNGGVSAVTNTAELRAFLDMDSVAKDKVQLALEGELDPVHRAVLELRQEAGKSSVAKLGALMDYAASDGRARGMLLYHGASTGRWSGRGPQPQNLPRPEMTQEEIEKALATIRGWGDTIASLYDAIERRFGPPIQVISSLLRALFIGDAGARLISGDFAQIEARVLAWLAGQQDLVELFAANGPVYEEMAGTIYGVDPATISKDDPRRQLGKNTVLGCGFQMGDVTFVEQAAKQGVIVEPELAELAVESYRTRFDRIPAYWYELNDTSIKAAANPGEVFSAGPYGRVRFTKRGGFLWVILPSGRPLAYAKPSIVKHEVTPKDPDKEPFTVTAVQFSGLSSTGKWKRMHAYGGKWTENIVQAVARDVMVAAMLRTAEAGYEPLLTVHDEVLSQAPLGRGSLDEYLDLMRVTPNWADGLPVEVEGWEGRRYRK